MSWEECEMICGVCVNMRVWETEITVEQGRERGLRLAWCNAMCQTQWSAIICGRSLSTEGYPAYIDTLHTQTCCDPLRQGPDCLWLSLSNWMCQTRFQKSSPIAELSIWFIMGCYRVQSDTMCFSAPMFPFH